MKFSACWITKNEEKNILRSMNSLRDAVDEMIVVDTGSEDDTIRVAQDAGARIEHFEWINDFAAAKNFALDQVSGDIVFFLDADEWFEPAMTAEDRRIIETLFLNAPETHLLQLAINNVNERGATISEAIQHRIFRHDASLRYHGSIHEFVTYDDGKPNIVIADKWKINHCGYAAEITQSKTSRNIELLKNSISSEKDPARRHRNICYLVREQLSNNNPDEAFNNLKLAMAEPAMLYKNLSFYGASFAILFYHMLNVAAQKRNDVSRMEIKRKIVDNFKKALKTYSGVATIDLYYETLFYLNESRLLEKLNPALKEAEKNSGLANSDYKNAESALNASAAQAAFRRGKLTDAMGYAGQAIMRQGSSKNQRALKILLDCLRGQPDADIAALLNSYYDTRDPETLKFLADNTCLAGFRNVHAYYLDKCIKSETATKGEYLYLLILFGKYSEAVEIAKEIHNEIYDETVMQTILVAAVCEGAGQIFSENKELLEEHADLIEAFYSGKILEEVTPHNSAILGFAYPLIALAAGVERADEFAEVFSEDEMLVYSVKMNFFMENCLFEQVLLLDAPDRNNPACRLFTLKALVMLGRLEEAFYSAKSMLEAGNVNAELLVYLSALADRAGEPLKTAALSLYDSYMLIVDKMTDLQDMLNTGYVVDDNEKKKTRTFKTLDYAQFEKLINENAEIPAINGIREICQRGFKFFEEKSMHASAIECLTLALVDCPEPADSTEIYEKISGTFQNIGNTELAREIIKQKRIPLKN